MPSIPLETEKLQPPLPLQQLHQQIPIPAPRTTSQQVVRAFVKMLRTAGHALRVVTSHWIAQAVASSTAPPFARRPLFLGLLVLVLVLSSLGRLELWITGAGLVVIALSVLSALQELQLSKIVPSSYQDFLDQEMDHCGRHLVTLPHLSPAKTCLTTPKLQASPALKDVMAATTVNIAPSLAPLTSSCHLSSTGQEEPEPDRRDAPGPSVLSSLVAVASTGSSSNSPSDGRNKLDVLHCGTVIDIQGSRGFIIPHDIGGMDLHTIGDIFTPSSAVSGGKRRRKQRKMPIVIPFQLNDEQAAARQDIAVGGTVEFAYSRVAAPSGADSPVLACARNVTPVSSDDGLRKSRSALQSCKQAREVSFARAMEELTMISPRNVPVKHHVDLIKYAEKLDDQHKTRLDQCI